MTPAASRVRATRIRGAGRRLAPRWLGALGAWFLLGPLASPVHADLSGPAFPASAAIADTDGDNMPDGF